jgi:hypothetical protein
MSENNDILNQLKSKNIRIEAYKQIIRKRIEAKVGYELPLSQEAYLLEDKSKIINVVNVLFEALVEALEDTNPSFNKDKS